MALFRRNKTDEAAVPPEVQSYYQAENRERTWVAWLLAIATLFVTVLVVLGLFFGGRWAYRKINNNDNKNTATVQTDTSKENTPAPAASTTPQANSGNSSSPSSQTPPTSTTTPTTTPTTGSTAAPSTAATAPAPQAANSNLPNTGPGDIVAIFVVTSITGALFYDRVLRFRTRSHQS